jgi:hypothetical protein
MACWKNNALHASVLGCVELAEICTPSLDSCINPFNKTAFPWISWPTYEETFAVWVGIAHSGFGNGFDTRGGQLLDATRRITNNRLSLPLEKEQWKLEVQRLFDMSIIRIQMEVFDIARGTYANEPGFKNFMSEVLNGVCSKFKFQATGYKNLSFVGVLSATLTPLLVGLSIKKKPPLLWIIIGIWWSGKCIYWVLRYIILRVIPVTVAVFHGFMYLKDGFRRLATRGSRSSIQQPGLIPLYDR